MTQGGPQEHRAPHFERSARLDTDGHAHPNREDQPAAHILLRAVQSAGLCSIFIYFLVIQIFT